MNRYRLDVAILVPGIPFEGDTLECKSLGGSETAALCVARELAKLKHHVRVFSNTDRPGIYDGVQYLPAGQWTAFSQMVPHDVCVVQRAPELFRARTTAKLNLLWCHDLALLRSAPQMRGVLWNLDRVLVVSEYMKRQYREVYNPPESVLEVTRNGIELARFERVNPERRDRKKLIYAARPERGLDVLLSSIFPRLLKEDPELRLYLCGYDNPVEQMRPFYEQMHRVAGAFGDRIVWLGHLTKDQLYAHYLTSGVYVYPTPSPIAPMFAEVSCISAMEAQAAGLPVVTSNRGALPETLHPDAGTLIDGDPQSEEYQQAFVDAVLRYVRDDGAFAQASEAGRMRAKDLDWSGVAAQWDDLFHRLIAERNDNPHRLAKHFIRHSDILGAKQVLAGLDGPLAQELLQTINGQWAFTDAPDGYREQYERIGQTHNPNFEAETSEIRFEAVSERLKAVAPKRVLDFGCAHGCYTVGFSNLLPDTQFLGVDIDKHGIAWANKFKAEKAKSPANLSFRVGDGTVDLSDQEPFDALFVGETLEHLPNPWETISQIERWIALGGAVVITVPYGPWEYLTDGYAGRPDPNPYPHRAHIWEFDLHDLRDMFASKPGFAIDTVPLALDDITGEALGWHIVTYRADGQPCGRIDMDRKLALQRPRQTVSASIVVGPGAEQTLHWCLQSIKHVADEIVLSDCGMSTEARRIVQQYPVWIVPAPKPLEAGFEAPRNEGLQHCRMDWVLWIDTDEQLTEPYNVQKYLRENCFHGYSLPQYHFAVDTTFKPDMPIRLFRRRPLNGKTMRFFGMIHEHPEVALNEGPGLTIVLGDCRIAHVGYLVEHGRRKRFSRNYPMLLRDIEKYPQRLLQKHFICRDNMLISGYEMQRNGGLVSEDIRHRCLETIETWRQHFRGKSSYINSDTLEYYSQANRILGQGFEFTFSFAAGKDHAQLNGASTYRFGSLEDLEAELAWRVKDTVGPLVHAWY